MAAGVITVGWVMTSATGHLALGGPCGVVGAAPGVHVVVDPAAFGRFAVPLPVGAVGAGAADPLVRVGDVGVHRVVLRRAVHRDGREVDPDRITTGQQLPHIVIRAPRVVGANALHLLVAGDGAETGGLLGGIEPRGGVGGVLVEDVP